MTNSIDIDLNERLQDRNARSIQERDSFQAMQRNNLRDFAVQLRETEENSNVSPGSLNEPSFAMGPVPEFPGKLEDGPLHETRGHLSEDAHKKVMESLLKASQARDVTTRDGHTRSAAKEVSNDFLSKKGVEPNRADSRSLVQQLRGQVTANLRSMGDSLGLSKVSSAALAYSIERALELEGFKAIVNKGLEKASNRYHSSQASEGPWNRTRTSTESSNHPRAQDVDSNTRNQSQGVDVERGDSRVRTGGAAELARLNEAPNVYSGSTAATSRGVGMRHQLENTTNRSVNWLAERGIDRSSIRSAMDKHLGKLHIAAELSSHSDLFMKTASVIVNSDSALKAISSAATDREVQKAVGDVMVAAGSDTSRVGTRGIASVSVATGSMLRGDSWTEISRHVLRAGFAAAGAAAGGTAAGAFTGGAMALPGAVIGGEIGAYAGDKVLNLFDKITGYSPENSKISTEELNQSKELLKDRASEVDIKGVVAQTVADNLANRAALREDMKNVLVNQDDMANLRDRMMAGKSPDDKSALADSSEAASTKNRESDRTSESERTFDMSNSRG